MTSLGGKVSGVQSLTCVINHTPRSETSFATFLVHWPWANDFPCLTPTFPNWKMDIMIAPKSEGCCEDETWSCKVLSTVSVMMLNKCELSLSFNRIPLTELTQRSGSAELLEQQQQNSQQCTHGLRRERTCPCVLTAVREECEVMELLVVVTPLFSTMAFKLIALHFKGKKGSMHYEGTF